MILATVRMILTAAVLRATIIIIVLDQQESFGIVCMTRGNGPAVLRRPSGTGRKAHYCITVSPQAAVIAQEEQLSWHGRREALLRKR